MLLHASKEEGIVGGGRRGNALRENAIEEPFGHSNATSAEDGFRECSIRVREMPSFRRRRKI